MDQGCKTISIICPKYKQALVCWVYILYLFSPCVTRMLKAPAGTVIFFQPFACGFYWFIKFLLYYTFSHFPQSCPHNLIQKHLIKNFRFAPFIFFLILILKFTSSLLFKLFPFCFFFMCVYISEFIHFLITADYRFQLSVS